MTVDAADRTLCSRCMESFAASDLTPLGEERLCVACLALDDGARGASEGPPSVPDALGEAMVETDEGLVRRFFTDARDWADGRMWLVRLPLLLFLAYVLVRHLADPSYQSVLKPLNLGIHELGHYVFRPFGAFLCSAGGSILQCLVPLIGVALFRRQRDYFAIAFAFGWLATNLYEVAAYVGDARARVLPLVTPGGGPARHDWHFLLGDLGLLEWDGALETLLRVVATCVMLAAIAFGGWLLWRISRTPGYP
jgi:hypothetical protein